jgi:hypothetical protein
VREALRGTWPLRAVPEQDGLSVFMEHKMGQVGTDWFCKELVGSWWHLRDCTGPKKPQLAGILSMSPCAIMIYTEGTI